MRPVDELNDPLQRRRWAWPDGSHDSLCPVSEQSCCEWLPYACDCQCRCDVITQVRADERERAADRVREVAYQLWPPDDPLASFERGNIVNAIVLAAEGGEQA